MATVKVRRVRGGGTVVRLKAGKGEDLRKLAPNVTHRVRVAGAKAEPRKSKPGLADPQDLIVVVHGPQGCGKTANGEKLRFALGCARVVESHDHSVGNRPGDLILTNYSDLKVEVLHRLPYARKPTPVPVLRLSFDDAMKVANAGTRGIEMLKAHRTLQGV